MVLHSPSNGQSYFLAAEFVDVDATPRGGEGPNVAVIAGATAGGVVVVVAVIVLVIVVIIVLLCWKGYVHASLQQEACGQ